MVEQDPFELLEQLQDERSTNRRRETFLASVIVHLLIVLLVVTQPDWFRKFLQTEPVVPVRPRDVTMLYEPNLPKVKTPPKTPVLSDVNRRAQPGNSLPKYQPPPTPAAVAPQPAPASGPKPAEENRVAKQAPPVGIPDFPEPPKTPPKQRPSFEQVRPEPTPSQAQLNLPALAAPSRGTDAILRDMAKANASGGGQGIGGGIGGGYGDSGPRNPKLNIPGPQIISDTMGVDFNPYLMRVLALVRRNWYSVIPEIARIGKQGRVELQFTISKNGNVPDLVLTGGSGTESMDGAALSSIRMSSPFPPLLPEFPGQDIRLRFIYLYNMPADY